MANDDDEIDPLDAYMASLCVPSTATTTDEHTTSTSAAAAASALDWSTARRWRCADAQHSSSNKQHTNGNDDADVTTPLPNTSSSSAVVKNRRYRRLQQLLKGEKVVQDPSQPGAMEANPADWYFSDTMMQQRNPALFHFHLGQYLPAAHAAAATEQGHASPATASSSSSSSAQPVSTACEVSDADQLLSSFLLSTNDRREMEMRRTLEQRTWGKFTTQDDTDARAREKALFQHDNEEEEDEEEESDDESSTEDEETKSDDPSAVSGVEAVDIDARRQVLVDLMIQRFLQGSDHEYVDYREIDANAALDDLEQMQRDAEDAYFDMDDD